MVCLVDVDLPHEKCMEIALIYIYGTGRTRTKETLESTGVGPDIRVKDLTGDELIKLRDFIQANYRAGGDLCREIVMDIRRKIEINCYQGRRHHAGLPAHGQRTKINAHTRKGPKRIVTGRKKTE